MRAKLKQDAESSRGGRFVDANEGKGECWLRERVGFVTVMWLGELELPSCSLPGGKYLRVICSLAPNLKNLALLYRSFARCQVIFEQECEPTPFAGFALDAYLESQRFAEFLGYRQSYAVTFRLGLR